MLRRELQEMIEAVEECIAEGRPMKPSLRLSSHRFEQMNRILKWADDNWENGFGEELHNWFVRSEL